ncbi:MAG: S-layer homology domain-containing protein [Clostridia bacterium]|nr:S-layer homology domain-containing protein [Clostridia bacterium]
MKNKGKINALVVSHNQFLNKSNENCFFLNGKSPYEFESKANSMEGALGNNKDFAIFYVLDHPHLSKSNKKLISTLLNEIKKLLKRFKWYGNSFDSLINKFRIDINKAVRKIIKSPQEMEQMVSFSALVVAGNQAAAIHTGNSMVYLLRRGQVKYVVTYFEKIERLVEHGSIKKDQIREFVRDNRISQDTGDAAVEVSDVISLNDSDLFLLSTSILDDIVDHGKAMAELLAYKDYNLIANIIRKEAVKSGVQNDLNALVVGFEQLNPNSLAKASGQEVQSGVQKKAAFPLNRKIVLPVALMLCLVFLGASVIKMRPWEGLNVFGNEKKKDSVVTSGISVNFKDIDSSNEWYEEIYSMVNMKVLSGYPDNTFRPDHPVSRKEFAKMIVLTLGLPVNSESESTFMDVSENNWANPYIEASKDYILCHDGDYYLPDDPIVREDLAFSLVKARGIAVDVEKVDSGNLDMFEDRDSISSDLEKYVSVAVDKKLMDSDEAESSVKLFDPKKPITRAEAAKYLYLISKEKNKKK